MHKLSLYKCRNIIMLFLKSMIFAISVGAYILCLVLQYPNVLFPRRGNIVLALFYFLLLLTLTVTYRCFRIGKVRVKELSASFFIALILTNGLNYLVLSLLSEKMLYPVSMLLLTVLQIICGSLVFIIANYLYALLFPARDALFLCGKRDYDIEVLRKFKNEFKRFDIKQVIHEDKGLEEIQNAALKFSTLVIGNVDTMLKDKLIEFCFVNNIQLYIIPTVQDIIMNGAHYTNAGDTPLFFSRNQALSLEQRIVKRLTDIFVSFLLLLIATPFMLITAALIKLYDGGPVLFRQTRYTYGGRTFTLVKFRSMIINAEKDGAQYTVNNDPRVTPIGKFIRATRIDELPQLFNILVGDMSLVGPRAERVENVDKYSSVMPEFRYRLKVKAGLTGYAQLFGKYNTGFEDKARMDIYYIVNYSLLLDIKLLLYTIKIIFTKESTDGFDESANGRTELVTEHPKKDAVGRYSSYIYKGSSK